MISRNFGPKFACVARSSAYSQCLVRELAPLYELRDRTHAVVWMSKSAFGELIAPLSQNDTVRLSSPEDGTPLRVLTGSNSQRWADAFAPASSLVASACGDCTTILGWHTVNGEIKPHPDGYSRWIRSPAFHPNISTILTGRGGAGTFHLFALQDGLCGMA